MEFAQDRSSVEKLAIMKKNLKTLWSLKASSTIILHGVSFFNDTKSCEKILINFEPQPWLEIYLPSFVSPKRKQEFGIGFLRSSNVAKRLYKLKHFSRLFDSIISQLVYSNELSMHLRAIQFLWNSVGKKMGEKEGV